MIKMQQWLARAAYNLVWWAVLPVVFGYLWWHGRHNAAYRQRWRERLARQPIARQDTEALLVHTVSVGEFMAARGLLHELLKSQPERRLVVTAMTPTGSALIQQEFGEQVGHYYLPFDTPGAMTRFLTRLHPRGIVLLETEVWPNLVRAAQQQNIPVSLVNARLSARSAARYRRFGWLLQPTWQQLTLCAAQTAAQAERFAALGVPVSALEVVGNLKFDLTIPPHVNQEVRRYREVFGDRQIITAGSTHEGEESIILNAFQRLLKNRPDTLLILVPRHRERFGAVAADIQARGFSLVTRSSGRPVTADTQVLLADTMGELLVWYGVATLAFVGGSLIPRGGHNPLEPMAFGLPVLSGREVFNFAEIYQQMDARQAVRWVHDADSLHDTCLGLLQTPDTAQRIGAQAQQLFARHRGATKQTRALLEQIPGS